MNMAEQEEFHDRERFERSRRCCECINSFRKTFVVDVGVTATTLHCWEDRNKSGVCRDDNVICSGLEGAHFPKSLVERNAGVYHGRDDVTLPHTCPRSDGCDNGCSKFVQWWPRTTNFEEFIAEL